MKLEDTGEQMSELLRDTQSAFDSVALDYDGPLGNNSLVQRIRRRTLSAVRRHLFPPAHILELGCGTGLDAETLGGEGFHVTAIDWSPLMVQRARERILRSGLQEKVEVLQMGFHQLSNLPSESFDGVYSDLGPLNCAADPEGLADSLKRIVKPRGKVVASVIGRVCPSEWIYHVMKGQWRRANLRFRPGLVPVPLNGRTVWTRYFMPSDFSNIFAASRFKVIGLRAIGLFVPPPYMIGFAERHPAVIDALQKLDDSMGSWPLLRNYGDHFLIVMQKNV